MLTIPRTILLAMFALAALLVPAPSAYTQPSACRVTPAFVEDLAETRHILIKLLVLDRAQGSVLDQPETARLYLLMLQSTRRHYEAQADALPACARPLNTVLISMLTATQDVLALRLADQSDRQALRTTHIQQARAHLESRWLVLSDTLDAVTLVPAT